MVKVFEKSDEKNLNLKNKDNNLTLIGYLSGISQVVNTYCSTPRWVQCELVKVNKSGGHNYLELTDSDESGKKIKSQTAILYSSNSFAVLKKFLDQTGQQLTSGMKLLLLLEASFKPMFGLSLTIKDIDPNYTVGALEIKYNTIRAKIFESGYGNKNRSLPLPLHFKNVAVLSPKAAAGLGDFKSEADLMERHNVCKFTYFTAKFEGDGVEDSITSAMKEIFDSGIHNYDVLVFIRGGGATSSLQSLNEMKIIQYVCRFPIPIISGIGHERDKVLVDEYVRLSIDTPSKVAEYIFNNNANNLLNAEKNIVFLENQINYKVSKYQNDVIGNYNLIVSFLNQKIENVSYIIDNNTKQISNNIENKLNEKNVLIDNYFNVVSNNIFTKVEEYKNKINLNINLIYDKLSFDLDSKINKVKHNFEIIEMNSHKSVLNKGYVIIKNRKNKIISTKVDFEKNKEFKLLFKDGELNYKEGKFYE